MNNKEKAEKIAFKHGLLINDEPSLYRLNIIAAIMSMGADRDNWIDMWRKACELIKFYKRFYEKERKVTDENLQLRKKLRTLLKGWQPASKDSDYDGTYLGYIEKHEECGAINHYQRTVFNRMNKWILTEGETLLYWMELPPVPNRTMNVQVSDTRDGE